MTGAYERELREVLSGTEKGVNAVTRSCTNEEKERMAFIARRPFLVVRAAGSGMEGSGDLVALRGDCCFPIEVKSTRAEKLYFSGRTKDQLLAMIREGERSGLMPLYAHRRKGVRGDSWRIFRVETTGLKGTLARLAPMIPALPLTRNGSPFIDWEKGCLESILGHDVFTPRRRSNAAWSSERAVGGQQDHHAGRERNDLRSGHSCRT